MISVTPSNINPSMLGYLKDDHATEG